MKIVLEGVPPSKKNSKMIVCRGSRPMVLPSKSYVAWHEEMMWMIKSVPKITGQVSLKMTLFAPNKRTGDLSNKFESVADLLVDAGIIEDDNWNVVNHVEMVYAGIDKDNPRVEIVIK